MSQAWQRPEGGETLLEFDVVVFGTPERAFAALTTGGDLVKWFCDDAFIVPALGGGLSMQWRGAGASSPPYLGRWIEFHPPRRAAFEGGHGGYPHGYAGRVEFDLSRVGPSTHIRVRHFFPDRPEYAEFIAVHRASWPRALERLGELLGRRS